MEIHFVLKKAVEKLLVTRGEINTVDACGLQKRVEGRRGPKGRPTRECLFLPIDPLLIRVRQGLGIAGSSGTITRSPQSEQVAKASRLETVLKNGAESRHYIQGSSRALEQKGTDLLESRRAHRRHSVNDRRRDANKGTADGVNQLEKIDNSRIRWRSRSKPA